MACGTGSNISGLGSRAACVLFWRRTEEILGVGGFANSSGASCRIPDELFGIAGEFVPPGADGERLREEADRHCRVAGRAGGGGENLSPSDDGLRGFVEGVRGILSKLSGADSHGGSAGWADSAGLRFVANK